MRFEFGMSTWPYQALRRDRPEVRLLRIAAGQSSEPLRCTLNVVSLDDAPRYETISYCWGEATRHAELPLNDSTLSVRQNAIATLCQVRSSDVSRTVWIDAVCINQDDAIERSQQVAMMGEIYRGAVGNLIHLDTTQAVAANAVRIAEHLARLECKIDEAAALLLKDDLHWQIFSDGSRCPAVWSNTDLISRDDVVALEPLYASAWFSRLWVVQEAAFAKVNTCFFKGAEIPLLQILRVGQAYIDTARPGPLLSQDAERGLDNAATMRRFVVSARKLDFHDIYMLCSRLATTDLRDMIFAVVNLYCRAADLSTIPTLLRPDYQKTTVEVFSDATRYVLSEEGDWILNHIHHRSAEDMNEAGKPSWMYIWGQDIDPREDPEPFSISTDRASHRPDATKLPIGRSGLAPDSPSRILRVKTFLCGKVDFVPLSINTAMLDDVEEVKILIHTATDLVQAALGKNSDNIADAVFQHALLASIFTAGENEDSETRVEEKARGLESLMAMLHASATLPADPSSASGRFYTSMKHGLEHRPIFSATISQTGNDVKLLGLGPKILQKDDIVVAFENGSFPALLRPNGERYQFIGSAYVPFLMDNEMYSYKGEAEWIEVL